MKFKMGIAPEMRNSAWRRPSTPPITNADDTDGICLRSDSNLAVLVILLEEKDETCSVFSGSGKTVPKENVSDCQIRKRKCITLFDYFTENASRMS